MAARAIHRKTMGHRSPVNINIYIGTCAWISDNPVGESAVLAENLIRRRAGGRRPTPAVAKHRRKNGGRGAGFMKRLSCYGVTCLLFKGSSLLVEGRIACEDWVTFVRQYCVGRIG